MSSSESEEEIRVKRKIDINKHKCPNYDKCQNKGHKNETSKRHWVIDSCPLNTDSNTKIQSNFEKISKLLKVAFMKQAKLKPLR